VHLGPASHLDFLKRTKFLPVVNLFLRVDKQRLSTSFCARAERYRLTPPFLAILREIEYGARFMALAIIVMLFLRARLGNKNSRSSNGKEFWLRARVLGSVPP